MSALSICDRQHHVAIMGSDCKFSTLVWEDNLRAALVREIGDESFQKLCQVFCHIHFKFLQKSSGHETSPAAQ